MKSYCVKQKKQTECIPGSEQYVTTKNGRNAMKCNALSAGSQNSGSLKGQQQVQKQQKKVKDYY